MTAPLTWNITAYDLGCDVHSGVMSGMPLRLRNGFISERRAAHDLLAESTRSLLQTLGDRAS